jgi:hypothetical protein
MKALAGLCLASVILGACAGERRPDPSPYPYTRPYPYAPPYPYPGYSAPYAPAPFNAAGALMNAPGPVFLGLGLGLGLSNILVEKERYEAATGGDRPIEPAEKPAARLARLQGEARRNANHADAWEALGDEQVRQGRMADAAKSYQTALPLARDKKHLKYKLEALKAQGPGR